VAERSRRKVLLIGWEAADWRLIHPLLDAGLMPSLENLVNDGVMASLATLDPVFCPLLWTSVATGKRADRHGVLGFADPNRELGRAGSVRSAPWRTSALWDILGREGLRSIVVGWPATHPARAICGVGVSSAYPGIAASPDWPMPAECVHPAGLERALAGLRVHPAELTSAHIVPFVPDAATIDPARDPRLGALALILAECSSIHAAATWLIEREPWDFCAVHYRALGAFSHGFMAYHPARMSHVSERDFQLYRDVVGTAYRFHDMMLGRLLDLAGADATVVLVSDHGFHAGHLRPSEAEQGSAEGFTRWHRNEGVLCVCGPGIRKDERIYGASVLDVLPTVLALFGLPAGDDLDGCVILDAFERPVEPGRVATWDEPGSASARLEAIPESIDAGDEGLDVAYNLARVHLGADRPAEAAAILQDLLARRPKDTRLALFLAQARYALGDLDACEGLVEEILERGGERPPLALVLEGALRAARGRFGEAITSFLEAERAAPTLPRLHCEIGNLYLQLRRFADAERAFRRALEIDGDTAPACEGLAAALLEIGHVGEAAQAAQRAALLRHDSARAHLLLGVAHALTGQTESAARALETSLRLAPDGNEARVWLDRLRARDPRPG